MRPVTLRGAMTPSILYECCPASKVIRPSLGKGFARASGPSPLPSGMQKVAKNAESGNRQSGICLLLAALASNVTGCSIASKPTETKSGLEMVQLVATATVLLELTCMIPTDRAPTPCRACHGLSHVVLLSSFTSTFAAVFCDRCISVGYAVLHPSLACHAC